MEHRVSKEQLNLMLDTLAKHREFTRVKGLGLRTRVAHDRCWNNLSKKLNAVDGGAIKTGHRWKRYWIDLKHKVKARALAGRNKFGANQVSETDEKVLAILGGRGHVRQSVTSTTTKIRKDNETGFLEVKNDEGSDRNSGDENYVTEQAFVDEANSDHSGVDETYISDQGVDEINIEEGRATTSFKDLESRRVAVQEKWAEAAATMAQAALLQAQAHQDLISILKSKLQPPY